MMRALGAVLKFIGGGVIGLLVSGLLFVVVEITTGGQQDEGPTPMIDPAAAKLERSGDGAVRIHKISDGRVLQRCRGACDEVRP